MPYRLQNFFMNRVSPGLLEYVPISLGPFRIFFENSRRYSRIGVNDTSEKFFAGVNFTGYKTVLPIPACLDLKTALWNRNRNRRKRNFLTSGTGTGTVTFQK